jgi:hypothetical protein
MGLILTLVGVFVTFISKPPVIDTVDAEKLFRDAVERQSRTPSEARAAGEKTAQWEKLKFHFSYVGVGLLVMGTLLQLIGTLCQLIRIACKGC